ncbi:choice-of-anchor Q domain-containing protein [Marinicella sp. W31]|uniref:choice-of-anchor Q domain-containing protein n=1 Tax=Marinicella sp. W31 TaxID=3023713 RepID=UPI0037563B92
MPNTHKKTALVTAILLEISIGNATAATIQVDGNNCSLTDAITAANTNMATGGCTAGSGDDVLELMAGTTFSLNNSLPPINSNITINGNGSTIERTFNAPNDFRVLTAANADLTVNDTTISGGLDFNGNFGAGIRMDDGRLIINRSTVTGNTGGGVVINNGGTSQINHSVISYNYGVVAQRYGSGVSVVSSELNIDNSSISNNFTQSTVGSGALYLSDLDGPVTVNLRNSTVSGNQSTNDGGGIAHQHSGNGSTLNVDNSTISGNVSYADGGGLSIQGLTTTIRNSTITQNYAQSNGGGLHIASGSLTLQQSLLAGNYLYGSGPQLRVDGGAVTLGNFNAFGFSNTSGLSGIGPGPTDIIPSAPLLSGLMDNSLADNGGNTRTHALNLNGQAIDFIPAANCLQSNDQTGKIRPIDADGDGNSACDIGAVEMPSIIFKNGFD